MGVIKFQDDAASDVAGRQHHSSAVELDIGANRALSDKSSAGAFGDQRTDAQGAIDPDREWERRKWMLQMGTIVLMGISGLGLHFFLKSIARVPTAMTVPITASAVIDRDYCKEDEETYVGASTAEMVNLAKQACLEKRGIVQNRTFNEK